MDSAEKFIIHVHTTTFSNVSARGKEGRKGSTKREYNGRTEVCVRAWKEMLQCSACTCWMALVGTLRIYIDSQQYLYAQ